MMKRILVAVVLLAWPAGLLACTYPTTLRSLNGTIMTALDAGGEVTLTQRMQVASALAQLPDVRIELTLSGVIAARDLQAVTAVMDTARAVSAGRAVHIEEGLRGDLEHLHDIAEEVCAALVDTASGPGLADTIERGPTMPSDAIDTQPSFREGMTRLSLIFTVYLVFLAFLLRMRHVWTARMGAARAPDAPSQGTAMPFERKAGS